MNRVVEFSGFEKVTAKIVEHCGVEKFQHAIGRLSSWSLGDDCDNVFRVRLYASHNYKPYINPPQTEIEITALNLKENGNLIISIHAIWDDRDKKFSFHS